MKQGWIWLLISWPCALLAQRGSESFVVQQLADGPGIREVLDTIQTLGWIPLQQGGLGCFTGYYGATGGGYVSGNNVYGDREKAQFYSLSQLGIYNVETLESVLVRFAYQTQANDAEEIIVRLYACDTSVFRPGTLLATSWPVSLSAIAGDASFTAFSFIPSVPLPDSFFVSVVLPEQIGDTLVIQTTQNGCRQFSHWSWEKWQNHTWHTIYDSWILDIDLAIFPVVKRFSTATGSDQSTGIRIVPNPANHYFRMHISRGGPATQIRIDDMWGRTVWNGACSGDVHVDCSAWPPGHYLVTVAAEAQHAKLRLSVVR